MQRMSFVLLVWVLVACAAPTRPAPTATLAPTPPDPALPTSGPTAAVATSSAPTATSAATAALPTRGPAVAETYNGVATFVTAEGYHGLGDPNAPASIVMYSDVF
ncbi:MAG: hypothetical protein Fur005_19680 [Roseiflexaceae bacterium]